MGILFSINPVGIGLPIFTSSDNDEDEEQNQDENCQASNNNGNYHGLQVAYCWLLFLRESQRTCFTIIYDIDICYF